MWFRDRTDLPDDTAPDRAAEAASDTEPRELPGIHCADCNHLITDPRRAISVNGSHHHTFMNPAGFVFDIALYSHAPGCIEQGDPTGEHSWFSGFSWRFAVCGGCGVHLGWCYDNGAGRSFFGLVMVRLRGV